MFTIHKSQITWQKKNLSLSTGHVARQAHGAVWAECGKTTVLCTVTLGNILEDADFLPLTVSYQERFYASGKIPGGFLKRESKPSERETLFSRVIDRSLRPLFPKGFRQEIQVVVMVVNYDDAYEAEIASVAGVSAALMLAGVPIQGPAATVRVGYDGQNFSYDQDDPSSLDLLLSGTFEGLVMVEAKAHQLPEETMLKALQGGWESLQPLLSMIEEFVSQARSAPLPELKDDNTKAWAEKINTCVSWTDPLSLSDKAARHQALDEAFEMARKDLSKNEPVDEVFLRAVFFQEWKHQVREHIMKNHQRLDGRSPTEIRDLDIQTGLLSRTHGSALFTRGRTQALVVTTLGTDDDSQMVDGLEESYKESFLLHYNFPSFSVGEARRIGPPGRREIGHGKLAWRALHPVLPEDNGYTIRVVSDILESDGSSSMATVCGGSLSLMNAGIPIKSAVAGIAMGLIVHHDSYIVLSDISGDEDALGDMDFKVAGTQEGITALQMDLKIPALSFEILDAALKQAKDGRLHILQAMNQALPQSRSSVQDHAPCLETVQIDKDKIRDLIGPGGRVIRDLCEKTQSKIDISDSGVVKIFSANKEQLDKAVRKVHMIAGIFDKKATYQGVVVKILPVGAFVNIENTVDGFLHISEISSSRVENVEDHLSLGQTVSIKVIGHDRNGKVKVSMKLSS